MSGGKGGSTSSSVEIPAWLENAAIENINRARDVQSIGYTPYYGPEVAAFSPMQEQAMQATGSAAQAFGLAPQGFDAMAGMPQAQEFAGGLMGYSSAPLYEQSVQALRDKRPAQAAAIEGMFIDPVTGQMSQNYAPTVEQIAQSNYAADGNAAATKQALMRSPEYVDSLFEPAADGGTGYYSGAGLPKDIVRGLSDDQFEAYTLAEGLQQRDPTTGLANFMDNAVEDYMNSGGLVGTGINYLSNLINPPEPTYTTNDTSTTYQNPNETIDGFTLGGGLLPSAPYVDASGEGGLFSQPVTYTPPSTSPSDFGARDWSPPSTVTTGVSLSDIKTGTGQSVGSGYNYDSSGRVGFGYGL